MNSYNVIREAEAVLEQSRPPVWDERALRRLLIAAWDEAVRSNFITRRSLDD